MARIANFNSIMKLPDAGIQEYWIVNVYERQIERYTQPLEDGNYGKLEIFSEQKVVKGIHVGTIKVSDLLP